MDLVNDCQYVRLYDDDCNCNQKLKSTLFQTRKVLYFSELYALDALYKNRIRLLLHPIIILLIQQQQQQQMLLLTIMKCSIQDNRISTTFRIQWCAYIESIRHIDPNATQGNQQQQDVFNLIVHHHCKVYNDMTATCLLFPN